jgi:LuxR family maltose regulon positive regulatory protein
MTRSAQRAVELETDGRSPFYGVAHLNLGHAAYVAGELEAALPPLARAVANESSFPVVRLTAMAMQSLVYGELGMHKKARDTADNAMEVVAARDMYSMPQAALALTAHGQVQATAGKLADAMEALEQGLIMRRALPTPGEWGMIHHLLVMARVAVEAGQLMMARQLLDELRAAMGRYTEGMDAMRNRLAAVESVLASREVLDGAEEPLTARELEVLRLLGGPLSLTEIAGQLYVSVNTVKTHTQAVYRKLGVHSRKRAVAAARRENLT